MKCSSDPSDGDGDDSLTPTVPESSTADGNNNEPAKKPRTETTSSSSEAEASSSQYPPLPPSTDSREADQQMIPDLGEDLIFEVLRRAEARTLAAAACVSRRWRQLAEDERLWEAVCVREWEHLGFSKQQLCTIVLALGGFRRLHAVHIRPLYRRGAGVPRWGRRALPMRLGRDHVQLSLSLFSIGFFEKMPNRIIPKKDKNNDSDKNGGGQCG